MLQTRRLILRPFEESDVEAAHVWFSDPEIFRFYTYGPYRSLEETATRIHEYCRQFEETGFGKWIVIDKTTGIPIGDAGLTFEEETGEVHVGYKSPDHVGGTDSRQKPFKSGSDGVLRNSV